MAKSDQQAVSAINLFSELDMDKRREAKKVKSIPELWNYYIGKACAFRLAASHLAVQHGLAEYVPVGIDTNTDPKS